MAGALAAGGAGGGAEGADGCLSSPPFMGSVGDKPSAGLLAGSGARMGASQKNEADYREEKLPYENRGFLMGKEEYAEWAKTCNLGAIKTSAGTFWEAAAAVLRSTHAVLRPGAVSAWVVKMYARDGKLVDFPGDWCRLLEATGFRVFLRVRAHLTKTTCEPGLFGEVKTVKKKASFFRRLYESKNPQNAIEWEDVVWAVRSASRAV